MYFCKKNSKSEKNQIENLYLFFSIGGIMIFPGVKKIAKTLNLKEQNSFVAGFVQNSYVSCCDGQNKKMLYIKVPVDKLSEADEAFVHKYSEKPYNGKITISGDTIKFFFSEYIIPYSAKKIIAIINEITEYFYSKYPMKTGKEIDLSSDYVIAKSEKPYTFSALLLVIVVVCVTVGLRAWRTSQNSNSKVNKDKSFLMQIVDETNKHCPIECDEITIFESVSVNENGDGKDGEGDEFCYNYIIKASVPDDFIEEDGSSSFETLRPTLLESVKDPSLAALRALNINFSFNYFDENGNFVGKVLILPEEYNE